MSISLSKGIEFVTSYRVGRLMALLKEVLGISSGNQSVSYPIMLITFRVFIQNFWMGAVGGKA